MKGLADYLLKLDEHPDIYGRDGQGVRARALYEQARTVGELPPEMKGDDADV